jgi:hypothetical protein
MYRSHRNSHADPGQYDPRHGLRRLLDDALLVFFISCLFD